MIRKIVVLLIVFCILSNSQLFSQVVSCESPVIQLTENSSRTLLAVTSEKSIIIYDTRDYIPVCEFDYSDVEKTSFSTQEGNELFAVMTKSGYLIVKKIIQTEEGTWECEEADPYFSAECSDPTGNKKLTAVAFSNNTDYVAAAYDDNSLQINFCLRVTQSSISRSVQKHNTQIYGLEFSKTGEYLASVSSDGEAYIWNSYNCTEITHMRGVFTRSRVPVYFTEDSVYIISQDGRNSFRISDFSGNTLYSIMTGRPITAIKPLKDPDLIAVRNDKNEVMVYSISSRRPISVSSVEESAAFSAFEFNSNADYMYAGFKDGFVKLVEPQPYLDDNSMLVTDSSLSVGKGKFAAQQFSCFSLCAGANYLNEPFLISADFRGEYLYSKKTAPFFVGAGFIVSAGFPRNNFPSNYKIKGQTVAPPKIMSTVVYIPAGYAFSPWNNQVRILTDFKAGAKVSALALISNSGNIIGDPVVSVFLGAGVGMQIKWFKFDINCEYDTVGKFSPSVYAGYVLRWGEN